MAFWSEKQAENNRKVKLQSREENALFRESLKTVKNIKVSFMIQSLLDLKLKVLSEAVCLVLSCNE